MRKITFDDLIIHFAKPRSFKFLWSISICILVMLISHCAELNKTIGSFAGIAGLILYCREVKRYHYDNRISDTLDRLWDNLPLEQQIKACDSDESWPECALRAIECYESHIPGDCENCGAE